MCYFGIILIYCFKGLKICVSLCKFFKGLTGHICHLAIFVELFVLGHILTVNTLKEGSVTCTQSGFNELVIEIANLTEKLIIVYLPIVGNGSIQSVLARSCRTDIVLEVVNLLLNGFLCTFKVSTSAFFCVARYSSYSGLLCNLLINECGQTLSCGLLNKVITEVSTCVPCDKSTEVTEHIIHKECGNLLFQGHGDLAVD